MRELGRRLESGDKSQLIRWIKPGRSGQHCAAASPPSKICAGEVDIAPNSATCRAMGDIC